MGGIWRRLGWRVGILMAQLPKSLTLSQTQTQWASRLNPILANPILQGNQISGIVLVAGVPMLVNHMLGKMQTGWFITDQTSAAEVFRYGNVAFNDLNMTLGASANCTISIWVY